MSAQKTRKKCAFFVLNLLVHVASDLENVGIDFGDNFKPFNQIVIRKKETIIKVTVG